MRSSSDDAKPSSDVEFRRAVESLCKKQSSDEESVRNGIGSAGEPPWSPREFFQNECFSARREVSRMPLHWEAMSDGESSPRIRRQAFKSTPSVPLDSLSKTGSRSRIEEQR